MDITIIGIDCATQARKIGLACGFYRGGNAYIRNACLGVDNKSMLDTLISWLALTPISLLAIDAPLGWPENMGKILLRHNAGQPIHMKTEHLFRRKTDLFIKEQIGKQPLDVGAERIARTAYAALQIIENIRKVTGTTIMLPWQPIKENGIYFIEVYPAATLKACGINVSGYKRGANLSTRVKLINSLRGYIELPNDTTQMVTNDNILDAIVCVLAGRDFLHGESMQPNNIKVAMKEGWIWVRKPIR